eukprot:g32986.t1
MAADDEKLKAGQEAAAGDTPTDADAPPSGLGGIVARIKGKIPSRLKSALKSPRVIGISAAGISLAVVLVWVLLQPEEATPQEKLQSALELLEDPLDYDSRQEAVKIAQELRNSGADIPEFQGGPAYVLGIAAFRNVHQLAETSQDDDYLRAVRYLREAERSAFDLKYRPEFAFALGVSLHRVGSSEDAMPLLEESIETFPRGKIEASTRLAEIYLDRKQPDELRRAVELSNAVLATKGLSSQERDRLFLQKAQIHLALKQDALARESLSKVSNITSSNHGTRVFRAQTLMANAEMLSSGQGLSVVSPGVTLILRTMAEEKFHEAQKALDPVANVVRLDQTFPRQALFLQGICAQRIAEIDIENVSSSKYDAAINLYSRTVQSYKNSHEGIAASLRLGDLLRASERDEEALLAYGNALSTVESPSRFRNRWTSLSEFRTRILNAWNDWAKRGSYMSAIKLSKMMSPLIPEIQSLELLALANHRWAERLTREIETTRYSQRPAKQERLLALLRDSGEAYGKLANLLVTNSRYPDMLWESAEHYRKGHAFQKSLDQLTRYINLRPKSRMAQAIVHRGQVLMDLDRFKEAQEHFQQVIDLYPTDSSSFTAQYEIANCHLELGKHDLAEKSWRNILSSNRLTPDATEWRNSLLSLSRLLYQTAVMIRDEAEQKSKGIPTEEFLTELKKAVARWEEARRRLSEFLERYPNSSSVNEARFLLAKSLQESAQLPRYLLKDAEVENVKIELRRNMYALLNEARDEFRNLQTRLLRLEEEELLGSLEQRFLRDCYFEIGHTYYALDEYRKAIVAYNSAANRYSRDPQVLLAYLQMANCNDRLGEHSEAISMLVQAKAQPFAVCVLVNPQRNGDEEQLKRLRADALRNPAATQFVVLTTLDPQAGSFFESESRCDTWQLPVSDRHLRSAIRAALLRSHLQQELDANKSRMRQWISRELVGNSAAMERLRKQLSTTALHSRHIVLSGEPGSGLTSCAHLIHTLDPRSNAGIVYIDCRITTAETFQRDVLGETGGHTVSFPTSCGCSAAGTFVLDHIEAASLSLQDRVALLLKHTKSDVRILACSNLDLRELMRQGRFRDELFHRLGNDAIDVPSLRERRGDIGLLAEHFLARVSLHSGTPPKQLTVDGLELLEQHEWPGNLNELHGLIEHLCSMEQGTALTAGQIGPWLETAAETPAHSSDGISLRMMERRLIESTFARFRGNREQTAKQLQIGLRTLSGKLREYGRTYDPGHPDADPQGYVSYPDIDVIREFVNAMDASRAYEANVTVIELSKEMANLGMRILA